MRTRSRLLALILAGTLAAPAWPQQAPAPAQGQPKQVQQAQQQPQAEEEFESKFIWGLLINYAVSKLSSAVFEIFMKWAVGKLTGGEGGIANSIVANLVRDSGAKFSSRAAATAAITPAAGQPAQIVVGNPDRPLVADGKKENYQGVHMALMMAEDGGKTFVFRPVNQGFRTGERFKLRVLSTFGGELTIDNINPRGERRQIYPPRADQVVTLLPSSETLLPLDANQFFEFTGATGREQLVISVADARAVGSAASRNKIFRQDTKFGSNFLQEASSDAYPSIQQSVELVHTAR